MVAILIILTILGFVVADALIQKSKARKAVVDKQSEAQPAKRSVPRFVFEDIRMPGGVFVGSGHTWLRLAPTGQAQVGMDDFAQRVIGRIDAVELPKAGEQVHQGQRLFAIRQGARTAEFTAPADGLVRCVNLKLKENPEPMKSSPFEEGWICSLDPVNLAKDLKELTIAEDAKEWLNREVQRFLSFIIARPAEHVALGHVLQDGGEPANGLLEVMDDETWGQFTQKFLKGT